MKEIVFLNRYFYPDHSATSQLLSELAFHLVEKGHRVTVITSRQRYDDSEAGLPALETVRGVKIRRVRTTTFGRSNLRGRAVDYLSFYLASFVSLLTQLRRDSIVVAKTDPPMVSVIAATAAMLRGARLINWVQDLFPEVALALGTAGRDGGPLSRLQILRDWSLRRAVVNVAIGTLMAGRISSLRAAVVQIDNWATTSESPSEPGALLQLRKSWGIADKCVVAYAGNFGRAHDFETIAEVVRLMADDERVHFLFIGGGVHHESLRRMREQESLRNLSLQPYQPQESLLSTLKAGDIHLVTLRPELEGLIVPSKFIGVCAAARPVIFVGATDGEIAGLIGQFECGFVVKPGEAAELKTRIEELAASKSLREAMGSRARSHYEARYTRTSALRRWEAVLESVQNDAQYR